MTPAALKTEELVVRTSVNVVGVAGASRVTVVLLSQSSETLLLGVSIDVGTNDKADDVEERHPGLLGQELLGKGQCQRRGAPADLHDRQQAGANSGADLMNGAGSGDQGHCREVDGVLNGRDLEGERSEGHVKQDQKEVEVQLGCWRGSAGSWPSSWSGQQTPFAEC